MALHRLSVDQLELIKTAALENDKDSIYRSLDVSQMIPTQPSITNATVIESPDRQINPKNEYMSVSQSKGVSLPKKLSVSFSKESLITGG